MILGASATLRNSEFPANSASLPIMVVIGRYIHTGVVLSRSLSD